MTQSEIIQILTQFKARQIKTCIIQDTSEII
jgi:hypothetical protein